MKKIFLIAGFVAVVILSVSFIQEDETARYKNLKVLPKDTNKEQIDSIMRHFSLSLGVRCTFCHVRETEGKKDFDFASDRNEHKIIARSMYKMMNKLNDKYFEHGGQKNINRIPDVSCYTCHHGKETPENIPPPPPPRK